MNMDASGAKYLSSEAPGSLRDSDGVFVEERLIPTQMPAKLESARAC